MLFRSEIRDFLNEARVEELAESGLLADPAIKGLRFSALLKRPEVTTAELLETRQELAPIQAVLRDEDLMAGIEMDVKYAGYIHRENVRAEQLQRLESMRLPIDFDYHEITTISYEAREKLNRYRPQTLGQAQRIDGVRPVDCSALLIHLKKRPPVTPL